MFVCAVFICVCQQCYVNLSFRTFLLDSEKILAPTTPFKKKFHWAASYPGVETHMPTVLNCALEGSHDALWFSC